MFQLKITILMGMSALMVAAHSVICKNNEMIDFILF